MKEQKNEFEILVDKVLEVLNGQTMQDIKAVFIVAETKAREKAIFKTIA